jgi:hypothetical protein
LTRLHLWPDGPEQLLLQAALAPGDEAKSAFALWSAGIDWAGDLEGGSFRLLPLVHANLARLGADHPMMGRLAGVRRYHWCQAQSHVFKGADAIDLLQNAGLSIMVSKGFALAHSAYPNPALRPMSDIDLLVPLDSAERALELLIDAGWAEASHSANQWRHRRRDMLLLTNGNNLFHSEFGEIDLHWSLTHESAGSGMDKIVWDTAQPLHVAGRTLKRPSPTFMLLHVITHGLRPNVMSPLRWVADAAMVIRHSAEPIDWPMLHHWAKRTHVEHRVAQGLAFLRDTMRLPVPAAAFSSDSLPAPSWIERLEDRHALRQLERAAGSQTSLKDKATLRAAQVTRLAVGENSKELPRLVTDWCRRNLLKARPAQQSSKLNA